MHRRFARPNQFNPFTVPGLLFAADDGGGGGDAAAQAAAQAATEAAAKTAADEAAAKTAAEDDKTDWKAEARKWEKLSKDNKTALDTSKAIIDAINAAANPGAAPVDPAKLADQLTEAGKAKVAAEVQLAVFIAATTAGANPVALLDRNSFTTTVKGLDPAAADFATKVTEAITAAVIADPTLKGAPVVPGKSGGEVTGGGTTKQSDDPQQRARDYYAAAATK